MMASDDIPPPEGVANAVAAHTSNIARVIVLLPFFLRLMDFAYGDDVEIPSDS